MAITRVLIIPMVATVSAKLPKMARRRSKMVKKRRKLRVASSKEKVEKPMFLIEVSIASTWEGLLARTVRFA